MKDPVDVVVLVDDHHRDVADRRRSGTVDRRTLLRCRRSRSCTACRGSSGSPAGCRSSVGSRLCLKTFTPTGIRLPSDANIRSVSARTKLSTSTLTAIPAPSTIENESSRAPSAPPRNEPGGRPFGWNSCCDQQVTACPRSRARSPSSLASGECARVAPGSHGSCKTRRRRGVCRRQRKPAPLRAIPHESTPSSRSW